jgi:hypothetical protein
MILTITVRSTKRGVFCLAEHSETSGGSHDVVIVQIAIKDKVFINEFDGSIDYRIPVTLSNKIILRKHIAAKL